MQKITIILLIAMCAFAHGDIDEDIEEVSSSEEEETEETLTWEEQMYNFPLDPSAEAGNIHSRVLEKIQLHKNVLKVLSADSKALKAFLKKEETKEMITKLFRSLIGVVKQGKILSMVEEVADALPPDSRPGMATIEDKDVLLMLYLTTLGPQIKGDIMTLYRLDLEDVDFEYVMENLEMDENVRKAVFGDEL